MAANIIIIINIPTIVHQQFKMTLLIKDLLKNQELVFYYFFIKVKSIENKIKVYLRNRKFYLGLFADRPLILKLTYDSFDNSMQARVSMLTFMVSKNFDSALPQY